MNKTWCSESRYVTYPKIRYVAQRIIHGVTKTYATRPVKKILSIWIVRNRLSFIWLKSPEFPDIRRLRQYYICIITMGPFHWHGITLIPLWISNYNHYKMWYETYPLQNLNVPTIEVPEWISNFTQHFIVDSWWHHIRCPRPYAKEYCKHQAMTPSTQVHGARHFENDAVALVLSQRHVVFAAQSNVFAKSRGGFRCVTFYSDIALRHVYATTLRNFRNVT